MLPYLEHRLLNKDTHILVKIKEQNQEKIKIENLKVNHMQDLEINLKIGKEIKRVNL